MYTLILVPVVVALLIKFADVVTFGTHLDESELDKYFEKHWVEYKENGAGRRIIFGVRLPFIAKMPLSLYAKWYIYDHGTISRWSKWTKKLDELHKEPYKQKLTDL